MTQRHSTIFNEIDFKLRMIAHFKKVHDKCGDDASILLIMIDQTIRADDEIWNLVTSNKELNKKVGQLERKYKLTEWFAFCDSRRDSRNA